MHFSADVTLLFLFFFLCQTARLNFLTSLNQVEATAPKNFPKSKSSKEMEPRICVDLLTHVFDTKHAYVQHLGSVAVSLPSRFAVDPFGSSSVSALACAKSPTFCTRLNVRVSQFGVGQGVRHGRDGSRLGALVLGGGEEVT